MPNASRHSSASAKKSNEEIKLGSAFSKLKKCVNSLEDEASCQVSDIPPGNNQYKVNYLYAPWPASLYT